MPQLFYFILKVILCSGILFGYYHLFLRNKVYHAYNRYYLLCAVILSLTVPLLQFDIYNTKDETQLQPIQMLQVVNNSDAYIEEIITTSHTKHVEVSDILLTAYIAIALVFFVSFILLLFRVFSLIRKSEKNVLNNIILVNSTAKGTPFSFFRYLFWNNEIDLDTETGRHIFSHELAHISERHSLDKIFMNIVLILCWINPFFWLIRKELNMIHEFIADKKAVGQYDTAVLASMIIQAAYPKHDFLSTNHFFYSPIKRRLMMLSKYKSTRATYFTRILVLPVLFILIAAFTFKAKRAMQPKIDKDFIVVIDAGHGGQDGGGKAVDGTNEKDLNLALAKMVKELNTNEKIKIILTRETDVYQKPQEKALIANSLKADLLISIHVQNGPPSSNDKTSGMEVYVARDSFQNSADSKILASALIGAFDNNYKLKVHPSPVQRKVGIWILQATKCPTVIIEAGYINHKVDRAYLKSKEGVETFATNVLTAIQNYLGQPVTATKSAVILPIAGFNNRYDDTIPKVAKDATIVSTGKYDLVIDNLNKSRHTDASQRLNEQSIQLNSLNKSLNTVAVSLNPTDSTLAPLYILDGKIISSSNFRSLDPQNIQSVNVLKRKAAESQYGELAKNGAVVIVSNSNMDKVSKDPVLSLSGISSARIHLSQLKNVKDIIISDGYKFLSATFFFSGPGFPNVITAQLGRTSLAGIQTYLERMQAGSRISIDNIQVENHEGKRTIKGVSYEFNN